MIPASRLIENPDNPRQQYFGLEELTDSIKQKGIIQPLLVFPQDGHRVIYSGHRRFRAGKAAGLEGGL
jgi:ParB family chromosome partitioning protein